MGEFFVLHPMFSSIQQRMDDDQELRDGIRAICKEIDRQSREIMTILQVIHFGEEGIGQACLKVREKFEKVQESYKKLKKALPEDKFYKYYDHWRFMTQRNCFLVALTIWLEAGILATYEVAYQIIGGDIAVDKEAFEVELEDFVIGIFMLCTELARLAVNCASRGDYCRVMQISKFVAGVNAGFRLLNPKNDNIRKGLDSVKYDVKKIEDVVYDLSLRGHVIKPEAEGDVQDVPKETGSQAQDLPEGSECQGQDLPKGIGSQAQDVPKGSDSQGQDVPKEG